MPIFVTCYLNSNGCQNISVLIKKFDGLHLILLLSMLVTFLGKQRFSEKATGKVIDRKSIAYLIFIRRSSVAQQ